MNGKMGHLHQIGILSSFIDGAYDGHKSLNSLMNHGDTGIGTINAVDGNIVIVDGECYHLDFYGRASRADLQLKTPFCMICKNLNNITFHIKNIRSFEDCKAKILECFPSKNLIYIIQLSGTYVSMKFRGEKKQPSPYKPLAQTIDETQKIFNIEQTSGDGIITWFPEYMDMINLNDFHMHYVDKEKMIGGHVYDFESANLTAYITIIDSINVDLLSENSCFLSQRIGRPKDNDVKKIEG